MGLLVGKTSGISRLENVVPGEILSNLREIWDELSIVANTEIKLVFQ